MDRIIKQSAKICTYPEIKTKQIHKEQMNIGTNTCTYYTVCTHTIEHAHTHVHTHHAHAHAHTQTRAHARTVPPFLSRFHQQSPAEEASKALGIQQTQHVYPTTVQGQPSTCTRCCIHTHTWQPTLIPILPGHVIATTKQLLSSVPRTPDTLYRDI